MDMEIPALAALQAATAASRAPRFMEHRWGARRPCRARACLSAGGGVIGSGRLRNISMSGALLETALLLPICSQVTVAVLGEDGSKPDVEFTATVVRAEPGAVGIEWCETADASICRLLGCAVECTACSDH